MIGIVVVSHSRRLAEAVVGLAAEMVAGGDGPAVAVAAGLDESTFGTDATAVAEAIGAVDSPDGVLVLLDLGSAVLSAELALEFLDPEVAGRVRLSGAPLVEGLVAAVVTASTGATLEEVAAEAGRGLIAKQDQLGEAPVHAAVEVEEEAGQSIEVAVRNQHGLHARPAARLVGLVNSFDASVRVTDLNTGRGQVNAGSISLVATLNAQEGHRLRFSAVGTQAAEVLAAIEQLAAEGFGDSPTGLATVAAQAASGPRAGGSGLDVAIGPAAVAEGGVDLAQYQPGDPVTEQRRLDGAQEAAAADLAQLRDSTGQAGMFEAQRVLVTDPEQLTLVRQAVETGSSAVDAVVRVYGRLAEVFEGLDDPYQRERAQDVRSVRDRLLRRLTGAPEPAAPAEGSILVVPELDAATAATVDAARIAGVAVRAAGTTGHGVIVARSRGIPLVTGIGEVPVATGELVGFDAAAGTFTTSPDEAAFRRLIDQRREEHAAAVESADQPATTRDGRTVPVLVNVGSVQDALDVRGADGAGLIRTEVLFGEYRHTPSAAEQAAVFNEIATVLGNRPITIRTWDIGGDKPLPFLPQPPEPNPFLGERGIRVFHHPSADQEPKHLTSGPPAEAGPAQYPPAPQALSGRLTLLREQLAAVREVAAETPVQVMFPMVTTAEEVGWALAELGTRPAGLKVGVMVEVPAAALRISSIAVGLDFVSIGTNDLTQYATAADRTNPAVAGLADGLDPAVLRLIHQVVQEVPPGVHVAVCGDLASDPDAAVLLTGLGVHELSATGPQVPLVKARLRTITSTDAQQLAGEALTCSSAAEVRALLQEFTQKRA